MSFRGNDEFFNLDGTGGDDFWVGSDDFFDFDDDGETFEEAIETLKNDRLRLEEKESDFRKKWKQELRKEKLKRLDI